MLKKNLVVLAAFCAALFVLGNNALACGCHKVPTDTELCPDVKASLCSTMDFVEFDAGSIAG